jgi:hypothetical protein
MRWTAHRDLQREIAALRAAGTAVVTFEPGRRTLDVMGTNAKASDLTDAVFQAAVLQAGRRASEGSVAARLRPLTSRRSRLHAVA